MIRTFLGLGALLIAIVNPFKKKKRECIFIILLDIAMRWANFLGRFQCFLTKGKRLFPAHW